MNLTTPTESGRRRREYGLKSLSRGDLDPDPVKQFGVWFGEMLQANTLEPYGVALATADAQGRPSVRMVLMKEYGERGFVFATSYLGRKAREMRENPNVALLFYWPELERQVRIEGSVALAEPETSDAIFDARPLESRLAAISSIQSDTIDSRATLVAEFERNKETYADRPLKRPDNWGAYRVMPQHFEFWQGGRNRLHDRFQYSFIEGMWTIERLQP